MARVGNNIFWQMDGEGLFETLAMIDKGVDDNEPKKFMHLLNLYQPTNHEGLGPIQHATLESMITARLLYNNMVESPAIDFVSVQTHDDRHLVPDYFLDTFDLSRNVTNVGVFSTYRQFPLLFDILSLAKDSSSNANTVIFTNSDICLTPSFYTAVDSLMNSGFDSLIINRRTVYGFQPNEFGKLAVADLGENHPGLDCFVFPRYWIEQFASNTACIGISQVMRGLLMNIVVQAKTLLVLTKSHLTYHYGDDRHWQDKALAEYEAHNIHQAELTYKKLMKYPCSKVKLLDFFDQLPKYLPKSTVDL